MTIRVENRMTSKKDESVKLVVDAVAAMTRGESFVREPGKGIAVAAAMKDLAASPFHAAKVGYMCMDILAQRAGDEAAQWCQTHSDREIKK